MDTLWQNFLDPRMKYLIYTNTLCMFAYVIIISRLCFVSYLYDLFPRKLLSHVSDSTSPSEGHKIFNTFACMLFCFSSPSVWFCLFVLIDCVTVSKFEGMSSWVEPKTKQKIKCLAQWYDTVPLLSLELATLSSQAYPLPTELLRPSFFRDTAHCTCIPLSYGPLKRPKGTIFVRILSCCSWAIFWMPA